ncbi:hypothetical protein [Pseudonocardia sp. H11422]|uniref:hypothetical protein n=1 Tax=Pseudonocardia sp. H11422 TaxID=2835866 RepID=UPI001BDD4A66|nr:hypothetical protein [Pseudonocardia sp. H11422]
MRPKYGLVGVWNSIDFPLPLIVYSTLGAEPSGNGRAEPGPYGDSCTAAGIDGPSGEWGSAGAVAGAGFAAGGEADSLVGTGEVAGMAGAAVQLGALAPTPFAVAAAGAVRRIGVTDAPLPSGAPILAGSRGAADVPAPARTAARDRTVASGQASSGVAASLRPIVRRYAAQVAATISALSAIHQRRREGVDPLPMRQPPLRWCAED